MLHESHAMRARLVGEIRARDDATAARVDAMLAAKAASAWASMRQRLVTIRVAGRCRVGYSSAGLSSGP